MSGLPNAIDVGSMGYQCPTCGAPIDVITARSAAVAFVDLQPCGHEVPANALDEIDPNRRHIP